jgi:hypothetical protein
MFDPEVFDAELFECARNRPNYEARAKRKRKWRVYGGYN